MKAISSPGNEKIKLLSSLKAEKGRRELGLFLVEGKKMISEAIEAGFSPITVLAAGPESIKLAEEIADGAKEAFQVSDSVMKKVSDAVTPQGIVASFEIPAAKPLPDEPLVLLDGLQDPGNCGAIWRTCEAAGFGGIVFCEGSANPYVPKTVRASMGSVFRVPAIVVGECADFCRELKDKGYDIIVSALDGEDFYKREPLLNNQKKFALVIGSEGRGVSPQVIALATKKFRLPMAGKTESLNASVAAGIMMYELFIRG
ncbi:MAG: TrmH family RNA methyltransferase [Christensenellales bacterium]|jgi:TrmH family RNA methyltransferase